MSRAFIYLKHVSCQDELKAATAVPSIVFLQALHVDSGCCLLQLAHSGRPFRSKNLANDGSCRNKRQSYAFLSSDYYHWIHVIYTLNPHWTHVKQSMEMKDRETTNDIRQDDFKSIDKCFRFQKLTFSNCWFILLCHFFPNAEMWLSLPTSFKHKPHVSVLLIGATLCCSNNVP
jgi:hypothetical protein